MKNLIENEAIKQISQYGFKKFTMSDIAKSAKISKKTIYKYYDSKENLIEELIDSIIKREISENSSIVASNDPIPVKLEKLIMINLNQELPIHFINELQYQYPQIWVCIDEFARFKKTCAEDLITQGVSEGIIRDDISPKLIVMGIESIVFGIIEQNQARQQHIDIAKLLRDVGSIFLYGITSPTYKDGNHEK